MAQTIEIDPLELTRKVNITLKIKRIRQFQIRIWLSTRLLILAALIGGYGLEFVEIEDGKSEYPNLTIT